MPIYAVYPDAVQNLYFSAVDEQNTTTDTRLKREAEVRGDAILSVVRAIYGSVTAGMLIADADMRSMAIFGEDEPMCGGVLLNDRSVDAASLATMAPMLGALRAIGEQAS